MKGTPILSEYSTIVVAFSGGKDSLACLLLLLAAGVPREKIELWHHDVDGKEGSNLMDWPSTPSYCKAVAKALGVRIYFSWKEGGFEGEMLRDSQATAPTWFETPDGLQSAGGKSNKLGTRRKFPQVSADLSVRWCSAYLKIAIAGAAICNQQRFNGQKTLFITGERAEESPTRAKYAPFEPHRTNTVKRSVDWWRPVLHWTEKDVWDIIKSYKINPHPAYRLGWGRVSCAACIFGSANQWASLQAIAPEKFNRIAEYEQEFGVTINRKESVIERAKKGTPYPETANTKLVAEALDFNWNYPVFLEDWTLPSGAFGESAGPS